MDKDKLIERLTLFALRVIKLTSALPNNSAGKAVGNQIVRSGTSMAANYRAAQRARSRAEFISKIGMVVEESDETVFWLDLIVKSDLINKKRVAGLQQEADELLSILCAIQLSAKKNHRTSATVHRT